MEKAADMARPSPASSCSICGGLASSHWAYTYGLVRRGVSPRTGQPDDRRLGTDEVHLCRRCERRVLLANLETLLGDRPLLVCANLLSMAGLLAGAWYWEAAFGISALLIVMAGNVVVLFVLRSPRFMKRGIFRMRRHDLAVSHGVPANQLEGYWDVAA